MATAARRRRRGGRSGAGVGEVVAGKARWAHASLREAVRTRARGRREGDARAARGRREGGARAARGRREGVGGQLAARTLVVRPDGQRGHVCLKM